MGSWLLSSGSADFGFEGSAFGGSTSEDPTLLQAMPQSPNPQTLQKKLGEGAVGMYDAGTFLGGLQVTTYHPGSVRRAALVA